MFRFLRDHIGPSDSQHEDAISSYCDYRLTVRYGFPLGTTCMAVDHQLSLTALGTDKGEVLIYGAQGLVWDGILPSRGQTRYIAHLYFATGKGSIVALCSDGEFYRFQMTGQHLSCDKVDKDPRMKKITSCHMIERPEDVRLLLIGTVCGNIYSLNIATLELAEYLIFNESIQPRLAERNSEFSGKTAINFIVSNPEKPTEMLFVLDGSLIVHYNSSTNELLDAELLDVKIENITWTTEGRFFVAQSDGEYSEFSTKPLNRKMAPSIFGPYPCMPIQKVMAAKTKKSQEPIMLISGGMLRATFGDRHTLTAKQGEKLIIFDLATPILDFNVYRPDEESGDILLILTENELIMIDLDDEEWRPILSTHFLPLHASTITAQEHCHQVEEHIWKMLLKYSEDFWAHSCYSRRQFPFCGGRVGIQRAACSASNDAYKRQLYISGHENGSVQIWSAGGFSMKLLFVIQTAKEFIGYEEDKRLMSKSMTSTTGGGDGSNRSRDDEDQLMASDDWPPFAKVGEYDPFCDDANLCLQRIAFDGKTGNLAVASRGGHIILYTLAENHNTLKPALMNVQLMEESLVRQNQNLRNNSRPMSIRTTEGSYRAGYQPFFNEANKQSLIIQLLPSTTITSLALLSSRNYLAAGNEFGYVLIDYRTRNEIMKNTLFSNIDIQQVGTLGNTLSRFRTMKQSIRQTFRRKKRTHNTNPEENKETSNGTTNSPRSQGQRILSDDDDEEQLRPVERKIEFRNTTNAESPPWVVRCIKFLQVPMVSATTSGDVMMVGTNGGKMLCYAIADQPRGEEVCYLLREVRLVHAAPILHIEVASEPGPRNTSTPRLLIFTEEQIRGFSLPNLRPTRYKYKMTSIEGTRLKKAGTVTLHKSGDLTTCDSFVWVLNNTGTVSVHSLLNVKKKMSLKLFQNNDILGMNTTLISPIGEVSYLRPGGSELQRATLSAHSQPWSHPYENSPFSDINHSSDGNLL